jgi:hypothetical protein
MDIKQIVTVVQAFLYIIKECIIDSVLNFQFLKFEYNPNNDFQNRKTIIVKKYK